MKLSSLDTTYLNDEHLESENKDNQNIPSQQNLFQILYEKTKQKSMKSLNGFNDHTSCRGSHVSLQLV